MNGQNFLFCHCSLHLWFILRYASVFFSMHFVQHGKHVVIGWCHFFVFGFEKLKSKTESFIPLSTGYKCKSATNNETVHSQSGKNSSCRTEWEVKEKGKIRTTSSRALKQYVGELGK